MAGLFNFMTSLKLFCIIIFLITTAACKTPIRPNDEASLPVIDAQESIQILLVPLTDINKPAITFLQKALTEKFTATVVVLPPQKLPVTALYAPGKKYIADTILVFLKSMVQDRNTYVVGITGKDICTLKNGNPYWGVMGLGYQPGNCCIVSNYRLGKHAQTEMQLNNRLLKVALHELGHNFGLQHCPVAYCLMTDAAGKDKLNKEVDFCLKCNAQLHSNRFMR